MMNKSPVRQKDLDLLVVDRSQEAVNGSVVIAAVEGELTVKRLLRKNGRVLLAPENNDYPVIDITEQEDTVLWGVVTYAIHKINQPPAPPPVLCR
jgi:DNA polymerase V